ncbi:MAG: hypothetical protein V1807_02985 [Patescibacteria group bacterium]
MIFWYILAVLVVGLALLWWISKVGRRRRLTDQDRSVITQKWQEIDNLITQGRSKEAIFEADKLLDFTFRKIGLRGETFADRLRDAQKLVANYQDLWEAHKVRNKFAHEINWDISSSEARRIVAIFGRAIDQLKHY